MNGSRARGIRREVEAHARAVRWPGDPAARPQDLKAIARRMRKIVTRRRGVSR